MTWAFVGHDPIMEWCDVGIIMVTVHLSSCVKVAPIVCSSTSICFSV